MAELFTIIDGAELAPLTTLELGGRARHLIEVHTEAAVAAAVTWAGGRALPLFVLGGGSNVVVADAGWQGVVLRVALRGLRFVTEGDLMLVHAAAGEPWDALVELSVSRGWAGIECLAGIPGLVGATPIQNVGAYGQEVAETIRSVRALDRSTGRVVEMPGRDCAFGYRDSLFKRHADAFVVLEVTFALKPGGSPNMRYRELETALFERTAPGPPTLLDASQAVRALRRKKSMVLDPGDPNRRSVGSFFTNPVLSRAAAATAVDRAVAVGAARVAADVPQFAVAEGGEQVKLSAGWLIEHAGFAKGYRQGPVGLSSNHPLALIHHDGGGGGRVGTTAELLGLARQIRDAVATRFGVTLVPEPVLVGTRW